MAYLNGLWWLSCLYFPLLLAEGMSSGSSPTSGTSPSSISSSSKSASRVMSTALPHPGWHSVQRKHKLDVM